LPDAVRQFCLPHDAKDFCGGLRVIIFYPEK